MDLITNHEINDVQLWRKDKFTASGTPIKGGGGVRRRLQSLQISQPHSCSSQSYIFSWSISSPLQLTYLGPPFNEKDFSPPRPNTTALSLPSAATRLELWHGLENQARLAQNQKAYSILLAAVRELARSTLCPSLKTSLLHFCTGLDGLLGSISALMTSLGYTLPPPSYDDNRNNAEELQYLQREAGGDRPAALVSQRIYGSRAGSRTESGQKNSQRRSGTMVVRGETNLGGKRRGNEGRRATSGGRRSGGSREKGGGNGRRTTRQAELESKSFREDSVEVWKEEEKMGLQEDGQQGQWRRRRLLSFSEGEEKMMKVSYLSNLNLQVDSQHNQHSYSLNAHHTDTYREEDGFFVQPRRRFMVEEERQTVSSSSSSFHQKHRLPRSLPSSTLQPSLSTISLHYDLGGGEEHTFLSQPVPLSLQRGTSLLAPPLTPFLSSTSPSSSLLSVRPQMNDFARKVEGFWILRELQSWLWRSAKDFNRLKKRLRGWAASRECIKIHICYLHNFLVEASETKALKYPHD